MSQLRYSVQGRRDLLDLWTHIARENPAAADRVYDRLETRTAALARFPELGSSRPRIAEGVRVLVEHPYLILYRVVSDAVQIVHGARHIDEVLFGARPRLSAAASH